MKAKPLRTVLAFYGPDEAESGGVYESLDGTGGNRAYRCGPADAVDLPIGETWERYDAVRLDEECLIMVRTAPADVQSFVQRFQRVGSPAVFVLSGAAA